MGLDPTYYQIVIERLSGTIPIARLLEFEFDIACAFSTTISSYIQANPVQMRDAVDCLEKVLAPIQEYA